MSKTINKEDVITITVGELFSACYDNHINSGANHVEAHSVSDDIVAKLTKKESGEDLSFENGKWVKTIPEPYYYGLVSFLYKRLTFWRDSHGRKAQFIGW